MSILDKVMFWKKKDEFADMGLEDKDNLAFGNDFGATPGGPAPGTGLGQMPGGQDFGSQGFGQQPMGQTQSYPSSQPQMPSYPQQQFQPQQPSYMNPQQDLESKNLEIISSKLDALRASIESLSQRMANLEAIARGDEESSRRRRYY